MSIASNVTRVQYAVTSASSAPLTIPFRFDEDGWLIVYYVETGSQEAVILSNGSGYIVTGDGVIIEGYLTLNGAFLTSIDSGVLTISRKTPALQNLNLQYSQRLPAELLELELDRLAMAVQDRDLSPNSVGSRAVVFPLTEPPSNSNVLDIAGNRINKFWGGDASGKMVFRNAQEVANLILGYLGGPPSTTDYLSAISAIQPIRLISPPTSATIGQGGQIAFLPYDPSGIRVLGLQNVPDTNGDTGNFPSSVDLYKTANQTYFSSSESYPPGEIYQYNCTFFDDPLGDDRWVMNGTLFAIPVEDSKQFGIFADPGNEITPDLASWPYGVTVELLAEKPGRLWFNSAKTGDVPVWIEILPPDPVPSEYSASIALTAAFSFAQNVETTIPFDTETFDTEGTIADLPTNSLVVRRTGIYTVSISAGLNTLAEATTRFNLSVRRNNVPIMGGENNVPSGGFPIVSASEPQFLNAGDVLTGIIFQNSSTSRATLNTLATHQPKLSIKGTPSVPPAIVPLISQRVVGFGDSQTKGNICGTDRVWGKHLTSNFVNLGFPGYRSADLLTIVSQAQDAAQLGSVLIVYAGANDIGANDSATSSVDSIEAICNACAGLYSKIGVVTITPADFPPYGISGATYETRRQALITELVSRYTGFCDFLARIDQNPTIGDFGDQYDRRYFNDGLHLTDLGQKIVAQVIAPLI